MEVSSNMFDLSLFFEQLGQLVNGFLVQLAAAISGVFAALFGGGV